jgi:hypothetical protein
MCAMRSPIFTLNYGEILTKITALRTKSMRLHNFGACVALVSVYLRMQRWRQKQQSRPKAALRVT